MARLEVVESGDEQVTEIYAALTAKLGKVINIFKGMANSPAALKAYLGFSAGLGEGLLTAEEREIIALTVAEENDCKYCLAAHSAIGKGVGIDDETNKLIREGVSTNPKHQALITFTLEMLATTGYVSNDNIKVFKDAGYTDGHIVEVVAGIAQNTFTNFFNHVNDTEVDFPEAP